MRLVLLFIDGVGIGPREPTSNPLAERPYLLSHFLLAADGAARGDCDVRAGGGPPELAQPSDRLSHVVQGAPLPAETRLYAAETTFGVPGRPQSASNQTALLTALEAPRLCGGHVLGFPNAPLRRLLAAHSVVARLEAVGARTTFANSFPTPYLDAFALPYVPLEPRDEVPLEGRRRRLRPSASTCAFAAAGTPFRTFSHAKSDEGLTHDIDGHRARTLGLGLPRRTPEQAADILWRIAERHSFTMFEHFLADEAGHARSAEAAHEALGTFDAFARAVLGARPRDAAVVICSDHGNVEDLSTRNHTRNPVPVLWAGPLAPSSERLRTIADVGGAILEAFGVSLPESGGRP